MTSERHDVTVENLVLAWGQKPLQVGGAKVRNINVTELIARQGLSDHAGYWDVLPQVVRLEAAALLPRPRVSPAWTELRT